MPATQFFIRDDDVGALTPALSAFMDIFAARELPVSYQIIPSLFTDECAQELRERKRQAPALFEFSQHGLNHEMMVRGRTVYYEFGPERNYDEQLSAIRSGRHLLDSKLGDAFSREVFTPPQHKYDKNTLQALRSLGVKVLSASCYVGWKHRAVYSIGRAFKWTRLGRSGISYHGNVRRDEPLLEISISVPIDNGTRRMSTPGKVIEEIERARRHVDVIGLMFHHAVYKTSEDHEFLSELAERLRRMPGVAFSSIGEIASSRGQPLNV